MAFVVQDPVNPVSDATAYIDVADFKAYHDDRGNAYTGTDTDIQQAIVRATDYMDSRWRYVGIRYDEDQSTECPRAGTGIEGFPKEFLEACAEYALIALSGPLTSTPSRDATGARVVQSRKKLDVLETEVRYESSPRYHYPEYPLADAKMRASGLLQMDRRLIRRS